MMFANAARLGFRRGGPGSSSARRGFSTSSSANDMPMSPIAAGAATVGFLSMMLFGRGNAAATATSAVVAEPVPEPATTNVVEVEIQSDGRINDLETRLHSLEKEFAILRASRTQEAFVFIKPHAVTDKVKTLIKDGLEKAGITITNEGSLSHSKIDKDQLIDTHYGAIAQKAVSLKPEELNVPEKGKKAFKEMFGETWEEALKENKVYNAKDGCAKLGGISGTELEAKWRKLKRGEDLLKFGGGFYVGKVDDIYIVNGFYLSMRDKYCQAPAKIHWYSVNWDPVKLSWEDFRGKVLGATDPALAESGSLRRQVLESWESLGLPGLPNVGDNGVHASASPFEGLCERLNWIEGTELAQDTYGKAVLALGIAPEKIKEWCGDAQVKHNGAKQSVFDLLEDKDTADTLGVLSQVGK